MNCCMVHLRRSHYHLLAFCLPEKFVFFFPLPFAGKLVLPSRRTVSLNCSTLKAKHFSQFHSFVSDVRQICFAENYCQVDSFSFTLPLWNALSYFDFDLIWQSSRHCGFVPRVSCSHAVCFCFEFDWFFLFQREWTLDNIWVLRKTTKNGSSASILKKKAGVITFFLSTNHMERSKLTMCFFVCLCLTFGVTEV